MGGSCNAARFARGARQRSDSGNRLLLKNRSRLSITLRGHARATRIIICCLVHLLRLNYIFICLMTLQHRLVRAKKYFDAHVGMWIVNATAINIIQCTLLPGCVAWRGAPFYVSLRSERLVVSTTKPGVSHSPRECTLFA